MEKSFHQTRYRNNHHNKIHVHPSISGICVPKIHECQNLVHNATVTETRPLCVLTSRAQPIIMSQLELTRLYVLFSPLLPLLSSPPVVVPDSLPACPPSPPQKSPTTRILSAGTACTPGSAASSRARRDSVAHRPARATCVLGCGSTRA